MTRWLRAVVVGALGLGLIVLATGTAQAQVGPGVRVGNPNRAGGNVLAGSPSQAGGNFLAGSPSQYTFGNASPFYNGGGYAPFYGGTGYAPFAGGGVYSPFFAGNFGYPYGGGGFGYGGLGAGFGYGGYGGYGVMGGLGATIGVTPFDVEMLKQQEYANAASQYNLQNAQAAQAYQAANYYRQQAAAMARANAAGTSDVPAYLPRYNITTTVIRPGASRGAHRRRGARENPSLLAREKVLDNSGNILWPTATPKGQELDNMRQAVDTAFRDVAADHKKNGHAAVRDAVSARDKLAAFGNLALEKLQADKADDVPEFQLFLTSLDNALIQLASTAPTPRAMPTHINPDNAPKSAGDVLKEEVQKGTRPTDKTPTGEVNPQNTPKSAGDVLKDEVKSRKDRDKD